MENLIGKKINTNTKEQEQKKRVILRPTKCLYMDYNFDSRTFMRYLTEMIKIDSKAISDTYLKATESNVKVLELLTG